MRQGPVALKTIKKQWIAACALRVGREIGATSPLHGHAKAEIVQLPWIRKGDHYTPLPA